MSEASQLGAGYPLGSLPRLLLAPVVPIVTAAAIAASGLGYGAWAWFNGPTTPVRLAEPVEVVEALPRPGLSVDVSERASATAPAEPDRPAIEVLEAPAELPRAPAIGTAPPAPGAPPVEAVAELLEEGPYGSLPRIEGERAPWTFYQRQSLDLSPVGRIALVIVGLGLDPELTEAATKLPSDIALAFSPYGERTAEWMQFARWRGHEVLLTLPLEPIEYPRINPGPATLFKDAEPDEIDEILAWLMGRGQGYVGFTGTAGTFGLYPNRFRPIARQLADRGLALFELGDHDLAPMAETLNVPFQGVPLRIDESLAPRDIEAALARLERQAVAEGMAIAYTRPYPLVFRLIEEWAEGLDEDGLALVPLTSTLAAGTG